MIPIATFHSPFRTKFGIPRQAGVVSQLPGTIVFEKTFRSADAIRGLDGFDHIWIIWECHQSDTLTVRPPRLGGNKQMGVFATRSPFRPNPLGLSSVRIDHIDYDCADAPVIHVMGADLMEGTSIYDIKPYIPYTDSHPEAKGGFTDSVEWQPLQVTFTTEAERQLANTDYRNLLTDILSQDPRPHYHNDPERIYGMEYADMDIRFRVNEHTLTVIEIKTHTNHETN